MNKQLLTAERGWYDGFACATLEVDPGRHQMTKGESAPLAVRFRAKDGALADATVQATPWGGAVDPAAGPATPGQPFAATFTLREERGGVDLIGTRRSRPSRPPSSPSPPSPSGRPPLERDLPGHELPALAVRGKRRVERAAALRAGLR